MTAYRKRWSELPRCPADLDADACLRGYRLIQLALVILLLVIWLR